MTTMNDAQQIFAVFYAIFWGAIFSVSSRWKAFNFGLIFDKEVDHVTKRIILAKLILNILPILYFAGIFHVLGSNGSLCPQQRECWTDLTAIVLSGIIPSFGIFGFYRLWLCIIEYKPTNYYMCRSSIPLKYIEYSNTENEPEPRLEKLAILESSKYTWRKNMVTGFTYLILSSTGTVQPYTIMVIILVLILIIFPITLYFISYINKILSLFWRAPYNDGPIEVKLGCI